MPDDIRLGGYRVLAYSSGSITRIYATARFMKLTLKIIYRYWTKRPGPYRRNAPRPKRAACLIIRAPLRSPGGRSTLPGVNYQDDKITAHAPAPELKLIMKNTTGICIP